MQGNKPEEKATIESQSVGSVSELKKKIAASQAAEVNSQKDTTRKDLDALRKRAVTAPAAPAPANNAVTSSTQKALQELRNSNVSAMRERLLAAKPDVVAGTAPSMQKQTTLDELKKLKSVEGNVRAKAKELEVFLTQSRKVLDVVKVNKVSEAAKAKLKLPQELKIFENQQGEFIDEVRHQLEQDIREFSENPKLRELGYAKFLELSFVYRSYEVCLEQDLRRHAATRLQKSNIKHTEEGRRRLELLTGIPSQMAVESLNYYGDFYKNLSEIEKIWPHAGILIRKSEIRSSFASKFSKREDLLLQILGDRHTDEYRHARSLFDNDFADFVTKNDYIMKYIENGNGLDTMSHPWTRLGFTRLPQPNTSINFKDIVYVDEAHAGAVHEVEKRVDADRVLVLPGLR